MEKAGRHSESGSASMQQARTAAAGKGWASDENMHCNANKPQKPASKLRTRRLQVQILKRVGTGESSRDVVRGQAFLKSQIIIAIYCTDTNVESSLEPKYRGVPRFSISRIFPAVSAAANTQRTC